MNSITVARIGNSTPYHTRCAECRGALTNGVCLMGGCTQPKPSQPTAKPTPSADPVVRCPHTAPDSRPYYTASGVIFDGGRYSIATCKCCMALGDDAIIILDQALTDMETAFIETRNEMRTAGGAADQAHNARFVAVDGMRAYHAAREHFETAVKRFRQADEDLSAAKRRYDRVHRTNVRVAC